MVLTAQRPNGRTAPVMAGEMLYWAAHDSRVDEVQQLLDQGVHPDEYRNWVGAAPPPGAVQRGAALRSCGLTLCCVHAGVLCGRTGGRR